MSERVWNAKQKHKMNILAMGVHNSFCIEFLLSKACFVVAWCCIYVTSLSQVFFDLMRLIRTKKQLTQTSTGNKGGKQTNPAGAKSGKKKKKCVIL